jgi:uncharacterized protein YqhQ
MEINNHPTTGKILNLVNFSTKRKEKLVEFTPKHRQFCKQQNYPQKKTLLLSIIISRVFWVFFFKILPIFLCSHTHHHPQDELAKFGYQLETKVKKKHLRILLYFGG